MKNNIKDCSDCLLPHENDSHSFIMSKLKEQVKSLKPPKKYGPITKMTILNKKTGKTISELNLEKPCNASPDFVIRVVTTDDQGRRITFFMKKANESN